MSTRTESIAVPIMSLAKGYNSYANPLEQPDGSFPDGLNMDLRNQNPHTIDGVVTLTTAPPPDGGVVIWADSFKTSQNNGLLNPSQPGLVISQQNKVILATDQGNMYSYDLSTNTYSALRGGLTVNPRFWSNARFRQVMLMTNGNDPPLKYDGNSCYPLGTEPVARFEPSETWSIVSGAGVINNEFSIVREGTASKRLDITGATTVEIKYVLPQTIDLQTGLGLGVNFASTDDFRLQAYTNTPGSFSASGAILYASSTVSGGTSFAYYNTAADRFEHAQSFTPGSTVTISAFGVDVSKVGSPSRAMFIEIQTDAAGSPSGTVVTNGTSNTVLASSLPSSTGTITQFQFPISPSLTGGSKYWFIYKSSDKTLDAANYTQVNVTNTSVTYTAAYNTSGAPTVWTGVAYGFIFNITLATGNITLQFYTSAGVPSYFSAVVPGFLTFGWNAFAIPIGNFSTTSSPAWNTITEVHILVKTTASATLYLDDLLLAYNDAPAPAQLVTVFNNSVLLGDQPGDRTNVQYSDTNAIDSYGPLNFFKVSGGSQSLEDDNHVSAMKVYAGICVMGTPSSIFSLSGAAGNFVLSPFSTEIGIDSHRSVVESPKGLYFVHDNEILALRLTSKDVLSQNITPLLSQLDHLNADQTVGIRNDNTHTLRWSFRRIGQSQNDLIVTYDYFLNAWWPPLNAHPVQHFFSVVLDSTRLRKIAFCDYENHIAISDTNDSSGNATIEGQPLLSSITLPLKSRQVQQAQDLPLLSRWVGFSGYLRGSGGGSQVQVLIRGVNHPYFLNITPFQLVGTLTTNPGSDTEVWVDFPAGFDYRYIQVQLISVTGQFELMTPCFIHYVPTMRPM